MQSKYPKRTPPFSLRLTREERRSLEVQANGEPLGSFIRSRLFVDEDRDRRPVRYGCAADKRTALAQILALLGQSNITRNLDALAQATRSGSLPLPAKIEILIYTAHLDIAEIKSMLLKALGIKED